MSQRDLIEAAANRYAAKLLDGLLKQHQTSTADELRTEIGWARDVLLDLAQRAEASAGRQ